MNPSLTPGSGLRSGIVAMLAAAALSGCYVVPMYPTTSGTAPGQADATAVRGPVMQIAQTTQTFTTRLYPSNAEAASFGPVGATVTSDMNGRGHFNALIGGEQFQGEATRVAGGQRGGVASASGTRGGILNCRYTMNSATLGSGRCTLNNAATFTMHVGG